MASATVCEITVTVPIPTQVTLLFLVTSQCLKSPQVEHLQQNLMST